MPFFQLIIDDWAHSIAASGPFIPLCVDPVFGSWHVESFPGPRFDHNWVSLLGPSGYYKLLPIIFRRFIFYTSLITSCTSHFLKKKTQPTLYPLYLLFLSLLPPTDPSIPSSLLPAAHPFSSVKGSNYDRGSNWSVLPTTIEVQTLSSSNYPHQVHSNTLQILPLPNVPFFWVLFRTYSHWRALQVRSIANFVQYLQSIIFLLLSFAC